MQRSADYWRGVLETAKQAGFSKLAIYGYEQLLAAAEAREAGEREQSADDRLDEALNRIYAKYGPRLDLFFADVDKASDAGEKCRDCGGSGIERSGVCHCGQSMEGHSVYDNHGALEMERACESCTAAIETQLASAAEVIAAAEKALSELLGATGTIEVLGEYEALEINASARRKMRARVDDIEDGCREAIALITRYKEANSDGSITR